MTATATVAVISAWLWTWGVGLPGGDSGESVAAIDVWGIAHAPGYFTYTTLGALFDRLVPVVDTVTTARSFSVVCTTAALVLLYRLAVALGVRRWIGAVTVAGFGVCTSVWFYATFPKHNALTLLFVVAILCCAHRAATDNRLAWTVGQGCCWERRSGSAGTRPLPLFRPWSSGWPPGATDAGGTLPQCAVQQWPGSSL